MSTAQLSLWEEAPTQDTGILEKVFTWADGDTTLSALNRLAELTLGDLQVIPANGVMCFYRVVSTGVVDGKVIGICEYVNTVKGFFGGSGEQQLSDGEVD